MTRKSRDKRVELKPNDVERNLAKNTIEETHNNGNVTYKLIENDESPNTTCREAHRKTQYKCINEQSGFFPVTIQLIQIANRPGFVSLLEML